VYRGSPDDGYYLDAYDNAMQRKATVVLDFFPQKTYRIRFINYSDKIIALYQSVEGNKVTQNAALMDARGRLIKNPVVLESDNLGLFSNNVDRFSYAVSENKKHIVIYAVAERKNELDAKLIWVDDSLVVKQKHTAEFKGANKVSSGDALVNNDGVFYMSAFTPIGAKSFADQVWLLALNRGEKKFASYEVPLDMKYAGSSMQMKLDNVKNRIYLAGFFAEKKNGAYTGLMHNYFDVQTNTFGAGKSITFDEQMRMGVRGSNNKNAFNDFVARDIIVRNDGGFVLTAENYYVSYRSNYPIGYGYYAMYYPTMASSINEYHYGDLMVYSFDADGNPEWGSFIRKDQYSQEDFGMFSSYLMINSGGMLGYLYNDFNTSNSRIQLASVDAEGKVETRFMQGGRNDDPDWLPRSGKQVSSREIIIPCLRKRQICFAKVVF
jgi:hypothetical protein